MFRFSEYTSNFLYKVIGIVTISFLTFFFVILEYIYRRKSTTTHNFRAKQCPIITVQDLEKRLGKRAKLVVMDNYVLDVT